MERNIYKESLPNDFMKKDKKRPHNFYIEDKIWQEFQIYCIKKKTNATKIISDYIKKLIRKKSKNDK